MDRNIIVNFTDDCAWEEWGSWVFKRCEVSSNEKLVSILHKVCNVSVHSPRAQWAKTLCRKLLQLIQHRMECCSDDNVYKKLKQYERILNL